MRGFYTGRIAYIRKEPRQSLSVLRVAVGACVRRGIAHNLILRGAPVNQSVRSLPDPCPRFLNRRVEDSTLKRLPVSHPRILASHSDSLRSSSRR